MGAWALQRRTNVNRIRCMLTVFVLAGVGVTGLAPQSSAADARTAFVLTDPVGDVTDMQPSKDIVRLQLEITEYQSPKMLISMTLAGRLGPRELSNYQVSARFPGGCKFTTVYSPSHVFWLSELRGLRDSAAQSTLVIECQGTGTAGTYRSKSVTAYVRGAVIVWMVDLADLPAGAVRDGWLQGVRGYTEEQPPSWRRRTRD